MVVGVDVKKVFKHVVPTPFVDVMVEKIKREIGEGVLCLNIEAPPGVPNELSLVEHVVGSSALV